MANDDIGLVIKVTVDDQTVAGLSKVPKSVVDANRSISDSNKETASSTREASSAFESLAEKFREYRREERTEGRYVRFFANQLQELTPVSKSAAMEIGSLGKIMAAGFGGGIGFAALEVAKYTLEKLSVSFRAASEEADKLAKERYEAAIKGMETLRDMAREAALEVAKAHGIDAGIQKAHESYSKVKEDLAVIANKYPRLAEMSLEELNNERAMLALDWGGTVVEEVDKVIDARERMLKAQKELDAYEASRDEASEADKAKAAAELHKKNIDLLSSRAKKSDTESEKKEKKGEKQFEKDAKERQEILTAWEQSGLSDREKLAKKAYDDSQRFAADDAESRATIVKSLNEALARDTKKTIDEINEYNQKAELDNLKEVEQIYNKRTKDEEELKKRDQEMTLETQRNNEAALSGMRSMMQSTMADMIQGQLTYQKFVQNVWSFIANTIADVFSTIITKAIAAMFTQKGIDLSKALSSIGINAAVAGSGAAAAASAGGPYAMLVAGSEAVAQVEGTYTPMALAAASAREGGIVPGYVSEQHTLLHPREMVLPADIAVPLRRQVANGGSGSVNVHIQAWDGSDVQRVVSSPVFARAIRNAQRNGRL
jgi:hypothetical protein